MSTAKHGTALSTSTTSSRPRNPIGTCPPSTGPHRLHPTIQQETSNRNASSPHGCTVRPWPCRRSQQSSAGVATIHTWAPSPFATFTARTCSFLRYASLPRGEAIREAIVANLAQVSGREAVATQQSSSDFWPVHKTTARRKRPTLARRKRPTLEAQENGPSTKPTLAGPGRVQRQRLLPACPQSRGSGGEISGS